MKRHGFKGLGASHGTQRKHRSPGSIGGCATPGRVFKGLRMAGRMGNARTTVQNLTVHAVDAEKGLLLIKGAVPGPNGGSCVAASAPAQLRGRRSDDADVDASTQGLRARSSCPREVFDVQANVPLIHQVVVAQLAAARQGTHSTKTRGEVSRRRQEAVPAEGHRPGPPGLDPRAAVRRRWRRARPAAARLRPADAEEDEGGRAARRAVRPGPRRPGARGRPPRRGRRAATKAALTRAARRSPRPSARSSLVVSTASDDADLEEPAQRRRACT